MAFRSFPGRRPAPPVRPMRLPTLPTTVLACLAVLMPLSPARAEPVEAVDRADAAGLAAALQDRILAAPSATAVLEAWCAERGLSPEPRLVARRVAAPDKPPSAEQRRRLDVGEAEPVRYRRVRLACGDHVLSEADNWYVPARLTPEMNRALDETDAPFGRVVRPLAPVRRNIGLRALHRTGTPERDTPLFAVDAVLATAAGQPFCEVAETYLGAVLGPGLR
jgi:chorismate-pyruvate lyase